MEFKEKIAVIQALSEDELRSTVLVPLFGKMGYVDPIIYHHANEKGKDIVMKDLDRRYDKFSFISVVVKAGDVNGSASGSNSYFALLNQVKQSLNEPYNHIYELKKVEIDSVIIVVSGRFLPTSLDSIYGTLKADRLDKAIKEPIDCSKLISLIDKYFSDYWLEIADTKELLRKQRDSLLNNISKLSKVLFTNEKDEARFLDKCLSREIEIDLFPFRDMAKYVASFGYYKIHIDEIDPFYADLNIYNGYCDLKEYTFRLKEKAKDLLFQIDEVVEVLKKILEEKDPLKIADQTFELDSFINAGGKFDFRGDEIARQEDYYYAVQKHKDRKELLLEYGYFDFYNEIYSTIKLNAIEQMTVFYNTYPKDRKDIWLALSMSLNFDQKKIESLSFKNYAEDIVHSTDKRPSRQESFSKKSVSNGGANYDIAYAMNNFGFAGDQQEAAYLANKGYFIFTRDFQELFFNYLGQTEELVP